MEAKALNKKMKKYSPLLPPYANNLQLKMLIPADPNIRPYYLTWYSINKSYPLGKLIGENLEMREIPRIYKLILYRAKKLSENV